MGVREQYEKHQLEIKNLLGVPADEPIIIFRAQDELIVETLADYVHRAIIRTDPEEEGRREWLDNFRSIGNQFMTWQQENPDKVKVPD